MRHIVIDTNCLVQMISLHSPYRPAWDAFRHGESSALSRLRLFILFVIKRLYKSLGRLPVLNKNRFLCELT